MAHVRLEGISKTFGGHAALTTSTSISRTGEFFVLLGPTGAGKTTTLRLIAGLERPDAGHIYIDGENVDRLERRRSATWRWCCSTTRSIRATRCGRTWSSR